MKTVKNNIFDQCMNELDDEEIMEKLYHTANLLLSRLDKKNPQFIVDKWCGEITPAVTGVTSGGEFTALFDGFKPLAIFGDNESIEARSLAAILEIVLTYSELFQLAAIGIKELRRNAEE
jgi:hypothetical protein